MDHVNETIIQTLFLMNGNKWRISTFNFVAFEVLQQLTG